MSRNSLGILILLDNVFMLPTELDTFLDTRPSKLDCLFSVPTHVHLRGRPQFVIIHYHILMLKAAIFLPRKWQLERTANKSA